MARTTDSSNDAINNWYNEIQTKLVCAMDGVVRLANDGELMDTWLAMGVPDGSSRQEVAEFVKDDEFRADCGFAFLEAMAMILKSEDPIYSLMGVHGKDFGYKFNREELEFE